MKEYLQQLIARKNLLRTQSYDLFSKFSQAPVEQQAAIMALFAAKKENAEELLGCRDFFLEQSITVNCPYDAIDIAGTGGDGIGTFNISTAASLVIASCGVYVAKHGGRSATSHSGSTDVLECLNLKLCNNPREVNSSLKNYKYAYLCAPLFNSELKHYRTLRKKLGFPSIFNILGPLLNPSKTKRQVIGVFSKELLVTVAETLKIIGAKHALVVHSEDGLDEMSVSAPTQIAELKNGEISEYFITPGDAGLSLSDLSEVKGGSPTENAKIIRGVFSGEITGAKLNIVLLNSAAGLLVAGKVDNFRDGVEVARNAVKSGKTLALLNKLQIEGNL